MTWVLYDIVCVGDCCAIWRIFSIVVFAFSLTCWPTMWYECFQNVENISIWKDDDSKKVGNTDVKVSSIAKDISVIEVCRLKFVFMRYFCISDTWITSPLWIVKETLGVSNKEQEIKRIIILRKNFHSIRS